MSSPEPTARGDDVAVPPSAGGWLHDGLQWLRVRLELVHTEAIKRAVESGLGIGCISRLALREAFRRGSLKAVETPGLDLRRQFQFVTHRRKHVTAGTRLVFAASTDADRRVRNMVMMIASPTTTSHAATTIVKNATT